MGREAVARHGQRKGDFLAGKYLLEDCLGVGGMGEVYRATNVSLGRKVAIKLLSAEYVHIEDDVLRFLREARAASAVRHTNVVDVIDVARDDDGTPFIVQELLSGEDLESYLRVRGGPLSFEEALEIMIPVADAVATAHSHDVVHRDLKPANIFLARERNAIVPKVLDFGACLFPTIAERSAKEVRMLIGTPHYMAPEQIVSKADVDARSDVWALGVILYEMLVGETPFEGDTANAVLQLVKTRDVPSLRERVKDAPADLELLIANCTKRDRLQRLANGGVVYEGMKMVRQRMRGQPISSRLETATDLPAQAAPISSPMLPSGARAPLAHGEPERMAPPPNRRLLTLNSPFSEPPAAPAELAEPAGDFHLDIQLPTSNDLLGESAPVSARRPTSSAPQGQFPTFARSAPRFEEGGGVRDLDFDSARDLPIDLGARPKSWPPPPAPDRTEDPRLTEDSSMPPVLNPRAAAPPRMPPAPTLPRENREREETPSARSAPSSERQPPSQLVPASSPQQAAAIVGPPAVIAADFGVARGADAQWSLEMTGKFVALIALPALVGFVALLAVPGFGTPLGRALRGDASLESGVLTVIALICAAALGARSVLGEKRDKVTYVAAGGSVLFGIVMIIVTSTASEASELGIPGSMGSFSTLIAPIAPLALALSALGRAREGWADPYARSDSLRGAAVASVMLFLTLALSPMGAVRTAPTPPQAPQPVHGQPG